MGTVRPNDITKIEKLVGPREFLNLVKNNRLQTVQLIMPKLGSSSFGKFKVRFK